MLMFFSRLSKQALSSLCPFLNHLETLHALAIKTDTPTPVLSTLLPLLITLITPSSKPYPYPLRPITLIEALRNSPTVKRSGMFGRLREQQDAQELWILLNGCIEEEKQMIEKVDRVGKVGLKALVPRIEGDLEDQDKELRVGPFGGMMAFRRSCQMCGYSEGIRLTKFDSLSLPVPKTVSLSQISMLDFKDGNGKMLPLYL